MPAWRWGEVKCADKAARRLQKLEAEHHIRYRRMIGEEVSAHACIRSIHCQHALGFEDLANATRMCTKTQIRT
jgi:hypothetical protein